MMDVPIVPLTALRSVKGPGGVMFSHVPTAGRFEQSPAITTGVPGGTLEKEELWTELDEIELFDEDELVDEFDELDLLTRDDEFMTDELETTVELELVAEDAFDDELEIALDIFIELEDPVDTLTAEPPSACVDALLELSGLSEVPPHPNKYKQKKNGKILLNWFIA